MRSFLPQNRFEQQILYALYLIPRILKCRWSIILADTDFFSTIVIGIGCWFLRQIISAKHFLSNFLQFSCSWAFWSLCQHKKTCKSVQNRQPNFEVATPKFYASLLDPTYYNIKSKLKEMIHDDNPETVAISLDVWSQYHNGYLGINCHYIDSFWKRKTYNLSCVPFNQSHTSEQNWHCRFDRTLSYSAKVCT